MNVKDGDIVVNHDDPVMAAWAKMGNDMVCVSDELGYLEGVRYTYQAITDPKWEVVANVHALTNSPSYVDCTDFIDDWLQGGAQDTDFIPIGKHPCNCDKHDLFNYGCRCGGV